MRIVVLLACLLALTGMPFCQLQAQGNSSIEGVLSTNAGAPVPNATVVLYNPATGAEWTATTNANGFYQFANLAPGRYTLRVTALAPAPGTPAAAPAPGAPPLFEREYEVVSPGPLRVDIVVTPTTVPRTDVLTGKTVQLRLEPGQIRTSFSAPQSMYLPESNLLSTNGAIFGALNLSVTSEAVATAFTGQARGISVAGGDPVQNSFRINGIDNNNKVYPGPLSYVSNMATEQFTLFASQNLPVFAHNSGGDFLINTGLGSNEWHGSAYGFVNNDALDATDNRLKHLGFTDNLSFDQWRIGGSLGFPIVPSKIFGYGNFEWIPLDFTNPLTDFMFVPTAAGFKTLAGIPGVSATNLGILQSTYGALPTGVPSATTTVSGQTIPLAPVIATFNGKQRWFIGTGAADFNFNPTNVLNIRYIHNQLNQDRIQTPVPLPIVPKQDTTALNAVGSYTHVFAPSITNDLWFGYNRFSQSFPDSLPVSFPGLSAFPNIDIGGPTSLLIGPQTGLLESSAFNTYHLADSVGWFLGQHQIAFGADALRYISSIRNLSAARGTYIYSGLDRFVLDQPPDVLAQRAFGSTALNDNRWLVGAWLQDWWRMRANLTLAFGLRYQYATLPVFVTGADLFSFSVKSPSPDSDNFSPHVGFAYSPFGQREFVIRANFGMMYDTLHNPFTFFRLGQVLPQLGTIVTATNAGTAPGFLATGGIANPFTVPPADITPEQAAALRSVVATQQPTPYTMRWDVAVETRLWPTAVFGAKYFGTRSVHQPVVQSVSPTSVSAARGFPVFFTLPSQATLDSLTLTLSDLQNAQTTPVFPVAEHALQPAVPTTSILAVDNIGSTRYNAAVAVINQRFAGGTTVYASYTYAHQTADFTGTPLDTLFGRQHDASLFERRNRATLTGMVDLGSLLKPWTGAHGWAANILANMNIAGTYIYQSGALLPTLFAINPGVAGLGTFRTPVLTAAGLTGGGVTSLTNSSGAVVGFLAPVPTFPLDTAIPAASTLGTLNALRFQPVNNVDLSFTKRFNYGDVLGVEFCGTAYNLVNHSQTTGVPVNSLAFMNLVDVTTSYLQPGNTSFTNPSRLFTNNARIVQLSARIIF